MIEVIKNIKYISISLLLLLIPSFVYAETSLIVRPQAGYGYLSSNTSSDSSIYYVGARILLDAGETQRYGLEISKFNVVNGENFTSLGIVLEQRLWDWFNMSIGTVGYFGYGAKSDNPIGLMTNLGWEPSNNNTFKPFVTYRNDVIFSSKTDIAYSVSVGFSFKF